MNKKYKPARVSSPGRILSTELSARGWSQKEFAEIIGRPAQAISEIVRGTKQITPETALEFAEALGTSPQFWTNLESNYRLFLAELDKAKESNSRREISRKSTLYSLAPVSELAKRRWIQPTRDLDELEHELCSFLEISSPDEDLPRAADFRQQTTRDPRERAVHCWLKRIEHLAREQQCGLFDRARLENAVPRIAEHANKPEGIRSVPSILREVGVRFAIVPHLPQTYVDGAVLRLDRKPVIAMTLRYDRIDAFWFTLMHELAHIVAGHDGTFIDSLDDENKSRVERQADRMAQDWLIDRAAYKSFVSRTRPYFTKQKVLTFAEEQGRHPGIIVGRLQSHGEVEYSSFRRMLVKVSPHIEEWIDRVEAA